MDTEVSKSSGTKGNDRTIGDTQKKAGYLDIIPTPVVAMDNDFTITYINPAGAGVLGQSVKQCLGKKCYDLFKTPHCNTPECRCNQAMQKNGSFTGETVCDLNGLNLPISIPARRYTTITVRSSAP